MTITATKSLSKVTTEVIRNIVLFWIWVCSTEYFFRTNHSQGHIQLLRYHKKPKIWTPHVLDISKFKVSLLHEEASEKIRKNKEKIFCWMPRTLINSNFVINIGIDILVYIQIFILMKAAFFLEGIQRFSLIINKTKK